MGDSSTNLHEAADKLTTKTLDFHRAIVSLMEELEAVDWYQQRIDATGDDDLKAVLAHNRDEEKEHAAMLLEWLRRRDTGFDSELKEYLFKEKPLREIVAEEGGGEDDAGQGGSLDIGGLQNKED
jgi:ferritin-like protein